MAAGCPSPGPAPAVSTKGTRPCAPRTEAAAAPVVTPPPRRTRAATRAMAEAGRDPAARARVAGWRGRALLPPAAPGHRRSALARAAAGRPRARDRRPGAHSLDTQRV